MIRERGRAPAVGAVVALGLITMVWGAAPVAAPHPDAAPVAASVPTVSVSAPSAAEPVDTALREPLAGAGRTVTVADPDTLPAVLDDAGPGDTVVLTPGTYEPIVLTTSGTATAPITLTGPSDAVFAGSGKGYTLHLNGAAHWQLIGFTVRGGGKGIMTDDANGLLLDRLTVGDTGDEAVHFRGGSSANTIQRSRLHDTGNAQPQYGEGVYVGSAKSNWKRHSGGEPDRSMDNRVVDNTFERITAENVDVKEETGGTVVAGNRFDGSAVSGENYADSVVDLKGFAATVVDNVTTGQSAALHHIIETHVITEPATSGCGNVIERNTVQGFIPRGDLVSVDRRCDRD